MLWQAVARPVTVLSGCMQELSSKPKQPCSPQEQQDTSEASVPPADSSDAREVEE